MVHGNVPNFANLVRLSCPFQRGSTVNQFENAVCNIVAILFKPGVGVTKAPFVNFSVSKIFVLAKVPLTLFESHLYLTGATAAELRRHLSNINAIFNR